ncbi:MAG: hypothetical protein ACYDFT_00725 [Thermoplasmata archaeon]
MQRHPRFHFHFVPASASWLNPVERGYYDLTDRQIRRRAFRSEPERIDMPKLYIAPRNAVPRSIQRRASADEILFKVTQNLFGLGRAGTALQSMPHVTFTQTGIEPYPAPV